MTAMIGNECSVVRKVLTRTTRGSRSRASTMLVRAAFAIALLVSRSAAAQTALAATPKPQAAPSTWIGLIGEYGGDNRLLVSERDGRLYTTVEWLMSYPMRELSPDVFEWPHSGLYDGEQVVFARGANGRATQVTIGGVVFPRRQLGPESGTQLRIVPVRPIEELRRGAVAANPPGEPPSARHADLVELVKLDSTIKLEIRYAGTNNFLGSRMYTEARAFMQRPAADALVRVNSELHKRGYGLLVHDAYRPWYVTKIFWDATPADKKWLVANPASGSRHNRGCAVDLTLYDLKTGRAVEMVSTYDESTDRAYADYSGGTSLERWHRALLRSAMAAEGFSANPQEWWHFDYKDWREYPILNIRFDQIGAPGGLASPARDRSI